MGSMFSSSRKTERSRDNTCDLRQYLNQIPSRPNSMAQYQENGTQGKEENVSPTVRTLLALSLRRSRLIRLHGSSVEPQLMMALPILETTLLLIRPYQTSAIIQMQQNFATVLSNVAATWFHNLRVASIGSFNQLQAVFESHFITSQRVDRSEVHLLGLKEEENESLRDYIARFGKE